MEMTVAERLAELVLSIDRSMVGERVWEEARIHFMDTMACMFLGSGSRSVETAARLMKENGVNGGCVFPNAERLAADAASCAMLCAMAAHTNDFDDMSAGLNGHPSAVVAPVVLAVGQLTDCTGAQMLEAYIAGVEADALLGRLINDAGLRKDWNPTTLIGVYGAAAAAGKLMGLDRDRLADAFGIASGESGGLKVNYGYMAKDVTAGRTAAAGVFAAQAARLGVGANRLAFEGPFGVFAAVTDGVPAESIERAFAQYRSDFLEPGLVIKPYPSCRGNHSGIDCMTALVKKYGFTADEVEEVLCQVDGASWDTDRYEYPETPEQAKFSLAFCIARVICRGGVSIEDFIGDAIEDRGPMEFISKVRIVKAEEEFASGSRFGTKVTVRLKNGDSFSEKECYAKGDPFLPMSAAEVEDKLGRCLSIALGKERGAGAARILEGFTRAASVRELIAWI